MRTPSILLAGLPAIVVAIFAIAAQPKVLYEKVSPYNTIVITENEQGLRTLQFERGGARQSVVKVGDPDHLELPYVPAMLVSLAAVETPKRVLIIGLGGGTIPTFLRHHYPEATIDVVDIDPDVVEVARQYFGFREDAKLRAHVQDGRQFIEECKQPYDLILLDAFSSDSIPFHLATREFLHAVRRALTPRGLVVGNLWGRTSNPLYDSMVRTYADVFDRVYLLDVAGAGNIIVFASPRPEAIGRNDLVRQGTAISREKQFRFSLGSLARYGFKTAPTSGLGGKVLTDRVETPVETPVEDPADDRKVPEAATP